MNRQIHMRFPSDFQLGIAESDLQTVGSLLPQQLEGAQKTMWEVFAKKRGIDQPLLGSYKYSHASEDAAFITNLGVKAYRTSVSMSRTIESEGRVNKKAIEWYREYLSSIKLQGVEIHLCLYHWEAPENFITEGILGKDFHNYFLKHVDIVLNHLGDLVDYFIPINELWCMSYLSYYIGIHAPGESNINKFFQSYFKNIELQAKVIRHIKQKSNHKIGIVNIHFPAYIEADKIYDREYVEARNIADNLTNYMYSDPFYMGTIDEKLVAKFLPYFPENYCQVVKDAKMGKDINYYGVNFYNSDYIKPADNELGYERVIPDTVPKNSLGWTLGIEPYYPNSLTDILVNINQRYKGFELKNIIVSENGTPCYTDTNTSEIPADDFRIFYIQTHLNQVKDAIAKGVDVKGYFLWTLLDNYEWQEGFKPESAFGIIAIDKKTGKRIPKKSYFWYQQLIKNTYV